MRYQGKVTSWKDGQGFGFVTPNGGGQKAFVHIKAFPNAYHRPIDGDIITYELATNEKGRFCAKNIRFASDSAISSLPSQSSSLGIKFTILFCLVFALSALFGRLPLEIIELYLIASTVTFLMYAIDKSAAQNNSWRTKESTLYLFSLVGGWPGAFIAQKTLRHKSKKEEFQTVFWITVFANCLILGWLITTKNGYYFLNSFIGQVT